MKKKQHWYGAWNGRVWVRWIGATRSAREMRQRLQRYHAPEEIKVRRIPPSSVWFKGRPKVKRPKVR